MEEVKPIVIERYEIAYKDIYQGPSLESAGIFAGRSQLVVAESYEFENL